MIIKVLIDERIKAITAPPTLLMAAFGDGDELKTQSFLGRAVHSLRTHFTISEPRNLVGLA